MDGLLISGIGVLDESALTGESRPVERSEGEQVRSGAVNAGAAFDLRAAASADQSTYAGIVWLVEQAQKEKTLFVRLADRYAMIFIPVTLGIAGFAWAISGDPVRALSVLVVATPCPLLLAAPIAIVAGISRAAKRGIIVKGGGALEALARGRAPAVRQDRDADDGDPRGRRDHGVRRSRTRRGAAARGVARPGLAARARDGDRDGRASPGTPAVVPEGRERGARLGDQLDGRGPQRGARQGSSWLAADAEEKERVAAG